MFFRFQPLPPARKGITKIKLSSQSNYNLNINEEKQFDKNKTTNYEGGIPQKFSSDYSKMGILPKIIHNLAAKSRIDRLEAPRQGSYFLKKETQNP